MSVEEDSSKKVYKPKKQTSWIWQYFKEETKEIIIEGEETIKISIMKCYAKDNPSSRICGLEYIRKDSSTGNAIAHLRSKHNITQSGKVNIN